MRTARRDPDANQSILRSKSRTKILLSSEREEELVRYGGEETRFDEYCDRLALGLIPLSFLRGKKWQITPFRYKL